MFTRMDDKKYMTVAEADQAVATLDHRYLHTRLGDLDFQVGQGGAISVSHEGTPLKLVAPAQRRLNRFLGFPSGVEEEFGTDTDLLTRMLNHSKAKRSETALQMSVARNSIISVDEDNTDGIRLAEVWSRIRELPGLVGVQWIDHVRNSKFEMRVISAEAAAPKAKSNDTSHAGLYVSVNGEIQVSPYTYTLICTNGMMADRFGRSIELHRDGTPREVRLEQVSAALSSCWTASQKVLAKFVESDETKVENPHAYLLQLMEEAGIGKRDQATLLSRLPTLPQRPSVYEVVSLVTNFAQSFQRRRGRNRFESFGGEVMVHATSPEHRCSHCHTLVSSN